MTAITHEPFVLIKPSLGGGVEIRTALTMKAMLTDLMLNQGEDIALWAETEAKRCADIWRKPEEAEPAFDDSDPEG